MKVQFTQTDSGRMAPRFEKGDIAYIQQFVTNGVDGIQAVVEYKGKFIVVPLHVFRKVEG